MSEPSRVSPVIRRASLLGLAIDIVAAWVGGADEADEEENLLPQRPRGSHTATHLGVPTPKPNAPNGRQYDHLRDKDPVVDSKPALHTASRWRDFAEDFGGEGASRGQVANEHWWQMNMPNYEDPSHVGHESEKVIPGFWLFTPEKRTKAILKFERILMLNPFVPLTIRLIVILFCALALGLAASIWTRVDNIPYCKRGSSTYMAIIVDTIAIAYTFYITYDEYTSKPLGLRSPKAKMRLIFLDLVFVVFASANLSLAFQFITDPNWACQSIQREDRDDQCPQNKDLCDRQEALTAVLLVALIAWLMTFTISVLRLMEKITRR